MGSSKMYPYGYHPHDPKRKHEYETRDPSLHCSRLSWLVTKASPNSSPQKMVILSRTAGGKLFDANRNKEYGFEFMQALADDMHLGCTYLPFLWFTTIMLRTLSGSGCNSKRKVGTFNLIFTLDRISLRLTSGNKTSGTILTVHLHVWASAGAIITICMLPVVSEMNLRLNPA
ncbi:hypothetical protein C8R44DRAFT_854956, partial [Mycena epipterygia]